MNLSLILVIGLIFLSSSCDTFSQVFLKKSINSLDIQVNSIKKAIRFILKLILIPRVWLSFTFSTFSLLIWLFVLSRIDLNFAFSLDSMHYILIAFASGMFLKERVCYKRWIGTGLIVFGIILVSLTK